MITRRFPETELLQAAAREILAAEETRLPNLSGCIILLPNLHAAGAMARALGQAAGRPLLLPKLTTLPQLAKEVQLAQPTIPDSARQSLLYAALRARKWFEQSQLWPVTQELLKLFDELTLHHVSLPVSLDEFSQQLADAYQATQGAALQFEARLVYELWHALRQDLGQRLDHASTYVMQLARLSQETTHPLYCVGLADLAPVEMNFLTQYRHNVKLFEPATMQEEDCSRCGTLCKAAWGSPTSENPALQERALALRQALPESPLAGKLKLFGAQSLEQEAQAAALQIRLWLTQGKREIAVVAQDRLSARRLRALLEREQILLRDETGWTFSTTAASSLIMRWLDLVSDDFYYQDLLDFLKSPLVFQHLEREARREAVAELELLIRENDVVAGLAHYLNLARNQQKEACTSLLSALDATRQAWKHSRAQSLHAWLHLLQQTLSELGIWSALVHDLAGAQLVEMLNRAAQELQSATETFRFSEWRHWLNQKFENSTFLDTGIDSPIVLTHLAATRLRHFDACLLLGCDQKHLPSPPGATAFFNQAVRDRLQLPTWATQQSAEQRAVAGLLQRSTEVLATWQAYQHCEINLMSPWLALLDTCHAEAYDIHLLDTQLANLLTLAQPAIDNIAVAPIAPSLHQKDIPQAISASGYGSLMACPYQYFARHVLHLNELDEVQLALEKRDFGSLVHLILHEFHHQQRSFEPAQRAQLEAALQQLSETIFRPLLRNNFYSRAWLHKWEKLIPSYIEWQITRVAEGWQWHAGEQRSQIEYPLEGDAHIVLKGQLDRLENSPGGQAVLDYKTRSKKLLQDQLRHAGEDVQLPVYALLAGELVSEAAYLSLDGEKVELVTVPDDIQELAQAVAQRLQEIFNSLHHGATLSAHGAEEICAVCEMEGLCRRSYLIKRNANG